VDTNLLMINTTRVTFVKTVFTFLLLSMHVLSLSHVHPHILTFSLPPFLFDLQTVSSISFFFTHSLLLPSLLIVYNTHFFPSPVTSTSRLPLHISDTNVEERRMAQITCIWRKVKMVHLTTVYQLHRLHTIRYQVGGSLSDDGSRIREVPD
jgi:hypothetical protein